MNRLMIVARLRPGKHGDAEALTPTQKRNRQRVLPSLGVVGHEVEGLLAVGGDLDGVALLGQPLADEAGHLPLVFHDQDAHVVGSPGARRARPRIFAPGRSGVHSGPDDPVRRAGALARRPPPRAVGRAAASGCYRG